MLSHPPVISGSRPLRAGFTLRCPLAAFGALAWLAGAGVLATDLDQPAGNDPGSWPAASANAAAASLPAGTLAATPALEAPALDSAVPPEINRSLRESQQALLTTNLVSRRTNSSLAGPSRLEQGLELARQQRQNRDFEQAEQTLAALRQAALPGELQRSLLLESALVAQDRKQLTQAQRLYAQFVQQYRDDPAVPEVLLRQGLLYREMGAPMLALSKFYAVMSTALSLKLDRLTYYQRLVLQAQAEIADTYYLEGRFAEAADYYQRLLRLENPELNREQILCKLVRASAAAGDHTKTLAQAQLFAARFPESDQLPEVRFLEAEALRKLGRKQEAMEGVLGLLRAQRVHADQNRELWAYWQQRAGNAIANQLYQDGDWLNALEIYLRLADLNPAPTWRLPAWYQAGLAYERLKQPQKAAELYRRILEKNPAQPEAAPGESLELVLEMARWRMDRLSWQTNAEYVNQQLTGPGSGTNHLVNPGS